MAPTSTKSKKMLDLVHQWKEAESLIHKSIKPFTKVETKGFLEIQVHFKVGGGLTKNAKITSAAVFWLLQKSLGAMSWIKKQ